MATEKELVILELKKIGFHNVEETKFGIEADGAKARVLVLTGKVTKKELIKVKNKAEQMQRRVWLAKVESGEAVSWQIP